MGYDGHTAPARYRAFISYSHRDAGFGRRLHRRLEGYRLPRRLVGRPTPLGPAPARLAPIFRDRDELPAADDLSAEIRRALDDSAVLIVVCSPAAKASRWVAREIDYFRSLGRPVLAALIEGDPEAAFPTELREPAAADFRRVGDGPGLAFLRLVAGLTGVGLDELVQRDAQRRVQAVTAVTAVAVAGVVALGTTTFVAVSARTQAERQRAIAERQTLEAVRQRAEAERQRSLAQAQRAEAERQRTEAVRQRGLAVRQQAEAVRQRGEAEGMVDYLMTDLRPKLEGVGRLDILTSAGRKAFDYYARQDLSRLSPESLERRAAILHALGSDDEKRGDLAGALAKFEEARRATARLLAAREDDPDRIYAHAQSEYWVALAHYRAGRTAAAKAGFDRYAALTAKLLRLRPDSAIYLREVAYAEGNLCAAELQPPNQSAAAVAHCAAALAHMEAAGRKAADRADLTRDLVNRHAWLADAYKANGDNAAAMAERRTEESLLDRLIAADPKDMALRQDWVTLQRALAGLEFVSGDAPAARGRVAVAKDVIARMRAFDPQNQAWVRLDRRLDEALAYLDAEK